MRPPRPPTIKPIATTPTIILFPSVRVEAPRIRRSPGGHGGLSPWYVLGRSCRDQCKTTGPSGPLIPSLFSSARRSRTFIELLLRKPWPRLLPAAGAPRREEAASRVISAYGVVRRKSLTLDTYSNDRCSPRRSIVDDHLFKRLDVSAGPCCGEGPPLSPKTDGRGWTRMPCGFHAHPTRGMSLPRPPTVSALTMPPLSGWSSYSPRARRS